MERAAAGEVLDLLAARDAWRDHDGVRRRRLHGGRQAAVPERDRDVVVLALEAERARHAAAARVHFGDLEAGPRERGDGRRRAHQRLLVAVAVEQRLPAVAREGELEAAPALALEELLQQE